MQQKRNIFWILSICVLALALAQKHLIYTKVHCPMKSNKLAWIECTMEDSGSFSVEAATNDNEISDLVGISELKLYLSQKQVVRVSGIRLELCNILSTSKRPSLLNLMKSAMQQSEHNLPKQCPFKRNTTYRMRHLKFDASLLPAYVAEYNFTFVGKFIGNNVKLFELRTEGSLCYINNDCTGANNTAT